MDDDYDRIAAETAAALELVARAAAHLAQQEVTWKSADGRITVRATPGTITGLDLAPAMPQRYDSATLAQMLTEALRAAQLKARKEFTEAFEESIPDRVKQTQRLIRESVRE